MHLVMSLLLLILTAACTQPLPDSPKVTADFRFSYATGLGIQNAGFLDLGTMYVWDISNKRPLHNRRFTPLLGFGMFALVNLRRFYGPIFA